MIAICAIDLKMFLVTIHLSYLLDPRGWFTSVVQSDEPWIWSISHVYPLSMSSYLFVVCLIDGMLSKSELEQMWKEVLVA